MDDLREKIIRFLNRHGYCTISTSDSNNPYIALVRYASNNVTLYCVSAKASRKVRNISRNSRVSVVVWGRSFLIPPKSLIIFGEAKILERDDGMARSAFLSKRLVAGWINSQVIRRVERRSDDFAFIKVEPRRIMMNYFKDGFIRQEMLQL